MYQDTVTVFTRYWSRLGDVWYPTVLHNVNINTDRSNIIARYGESSSDSAVLNIGFTEQAGQKIIAGKTYKKPKEWDAQLNDGIQDTITFHTGEKFDFFYLGEWSADPVNDDDYPEGFYDYMQANYDDVYAMTSVAEFSVIPHFEIVGR